MLKRVFLTLVAAFGLAAAASAQGLDNEQVKPRRYELLKKVQEDSIKKRREVLKPYVLSIGPKVGVNFSTADDPKGLKFNMSGDVGYHASAAFNLRFARPIGRPLGTERFGVQVEVSYAIRNLETVTYHEDIITLNCIEVPVLFQWYFHPNFALEVGPTFTEVSSSDNNDLEWNGIVFKMDEIKSYDVMLTVGLNCKLRKGFTASLRYNMGNSDLAGNFKTKVSTISLGIGWMFNVVK